MVTSSTGGLNHFKFDKVILIFEDQFNILYKVRLSVIKVLICSNQMSNAVLKHNNQPVNVI